MFGIITEHKIDNDSFRSRVINCSQISSNFEAAYKVYFKRLIQALN